MKKKLETELKNLARKVLEMKKEKDVHELKEITAVLYEKFSVLSYVERNFRNNSSSIGKKSLEQSLGSQKEYRYRPDGTFYNPRGITEPNTEMIKDIVAQMPPGTEETDKVLEDILPNEETPKGDDNSQMEKHGVSFDDLPHFEPKKVEKNTAQKPQEEQENDEEQTDPKPSLKKDEKRSLNQRLRRGVSFGLNDRVVYIKHLFDGSVSDYDRVISQLNTCENFVAAKEFIENQVKPDYNNWQGEEKYESKFLKGIKSKLD